MTTHIEIGDTVVVCFNGAQITLCYEAIVLSVPLGVGDPWVFQDTQTGFLHYVSEGCTVSKRAAPQATGHRREGADTMSIYYMIEKSVDGRAHWWTPYRSGVTHWNDPSRWTTDSSKARHYESSYEAGYVMGRQMPECFVTEHIDVEPQATGDKP